MHRRWLEPCRLLVALSREIAAGIIHAFRKQSRTTCDPAEQQSPQITTIMAPRESSLQKLFEAQIKDIYYAEKKLVDALPKMQAAAQDTDLATAFEAHCEETKNHVNRLEHVFELLGKKPSTETCEAMKGLIEEAEDLKAQFEGEEALDAALIAAAQKVEHYEIATYGTLAAISDQLRLTEVGRVLRETLHEEKTADEKLSSLANARNPVAAV